MLAICEAGVYVCTYAVTFLDFRANSNYNQSSLVKFNNIEFFSFNKGLVFISLISEDTCPESPNDMENIKKFRW